jgi:hypothetical protein
MRRNPPRDHVVLARLHRHWPEHVEVVGRDEAIRKINYPVADGPRYEAVIAASYLDEARRISDMIRDMEIEVARERDGTVVYRGPLLGFARSEASFGLPFKAVGRLLELIRTPESKLSTGKGALVARRTDAANRNPKRAWAGFRTQVFRAYVDAYRMGTGPAYSRNYAKEIRWLAREGLIVGDDRRGYVLSDEGLAEAKRRRMANPASRAQRAAEVVRVHGRDRTWRQRIAGGARRVPADFSAASLRRGVEVELEHTSDPTMALEIAMDHLDEDPRYYQKLRRIHRENPSSAGRTLGRWAWCDPAECGTTPPSSAARELARKRWTLPAREQRVAARILAI